MRMHNLLSSKEASVSRREFVVLFSWRSEKVLAERELLKLAKENGMQV